MQLSSASLWIYCQIHWTVVSREASILRILSSLQRKSSGKLSGHCMQWRSSSVNGVCELLKHEAKNVFRSSAFSSLVYATLVPICSWNGGR